MTMALNVVRVIACLLAIVAAFVAIPNMDAAALLVALGILLGIGLDSESGPRIVLSTVALPVVGTALAHLPMVGDKLGAIAVNLGLVAAGSAATFVAMSVFNRLKGDWVK